MFRLDNSVLLERFVAVEGNHSNFYSLIFNALLCWHWRRIDRERRVSKASPDRTTGGGAGQEQGAGCRRIIETGLKTALIAHGRGRDSFSILIQFHF